MPIKIPVPETPWAEEIISLNGTIYILEFKYNLRDSRWYITLKDSNEVVLKHSIKVVEKTSLVFRYRLDGFNGDIICVEVRDTDEVATRDNVGFGKNYELIYYNDQELEERGIT